MRCINLHYIYLSISLPIAVLLYNGPLLCGFNVPIKGLTPFMYTYNVDVCRCSQSTLLLDIIAVAGHIVSAHFKRPRLVAERVTHRVSVLCKTIHTHLSVGLYNATDSTEKIRQQ